MFEVELKSGARLSDEKVLWKGTGGIYIEGPHIYRKDGWWYLMVSEGGCFPDHMITAARSKELFGPCEPAKSNPILPPASKDAYIAHTGHGDLICDTQGQWWSICLGVRKYKGRYNMGRETFLTPVDWPKGKFPTISPVELDPPALLQRARSGRDTSRHINIAKPGVDLCYIRNVDLSKHEISDNGDTITLTPDTGFLSDVYKPTSFVGKRQRYHDGLASVEMLTTPANTSGKAGLAVYKDEQRYLCVYLDFETREIVYEAVNNAKRIALKQREKIESSAKQAESITFSVEYNEACIALHMLLEGVRSTRSSDSITLV